MTRLGALIRKRSGGCDERSGAMNRSLEWLQRNYGARAQNMYHVPYPTKAPEKMRVVVEVRDGVAEVTSCPDGVDVEIIDRDNKGR